MKAKAKARELDVTGLKCPLPVVRAAKVLESMKPGETLVVTATDPGSIPDILGWAKVDPRVTVEKQETRDDGVFVHTLRRA